MHIAMGIFLTFVLLAGLGSPRPAAASGAGTPMDVVAQAVQALGARTPWAASNA